MSMLVLRLLAVAGLLALGASSAVGEDAGGDEITVKPNWQEGQTLRYTLAREQQDLAGGKWVVTAKTTTGIEVTVQKKLESGYLVGWKYGEVKFDDEKQAGNESLQRLANLVKGLEVVLELDSDGSLEGIHDWDKTKAEIERITDVVLEEMAKYGKGDKQLQDAARKTVKSLLLSKEFAEQVLLPEANLFFSLMGGTYSVTTPLEGDVELANVFGGKPFPAKVKVSVDSVDRAKGQAAITYSQVADAKEMLPAIREKLRTATSSATRAATLPGETPALDIRDTGQFIVDLRTGWTVDLVHVRKALTGDRGRILKFELKQNQAQPPAASQPGK
jgi:hypothetical protein